MLSRDNYRKELVEEANAKLFEKTLFEVCRKCKWFFQHVFQSRYKSLVREEGRPLLGLVNYIHLDPVRAGLVTVRKLRTYQTSSYPKFFQSRPPEPLRRGRFLSALELPDSVAG